MSHSRTPALQAFDAHTFPDAHAVSLTPHTRKIGDLKVDYRREFEAEFKKALVRESGARGGLLDEKTEGRKSRDTVPLIKFVL
jgi:hypothetical protein